MNQTVLLSMGGHPTPDTDVPSVLVTESVHDGPRPRGATYLRECSLIAAHNSVQIGCLELHNVCSAIKRSLLLSTGLFRSISRSSFEGSADMVAYYL